MSPFKLFLTLYVISVGLIYALSAKTGVPFVIPGDIYIRKATKKIYIPLGSSLVLTVIVFLLLRGFLK